MFDQKVNFESIAKKLSDSTFGLYHNVDLEVIDAHYELTSYFKELLQNGMIGSRELDIKLNTISNVCESITIQIKVHKPGRYETWFKTLHR